MIRPGEEGYNVDPMYTDEKSMISVTIDELIKELQDAREVLGGDCICMMSYDGGAGYDEIRSIHGQDFHDNLILTLSCCKDPEFNKVVLYESSDIPDYKL